MPGSSPPSEAWLLACRAVGGVAGIEFRPPPGHDHVRLQDPIGAIAGASGVRTRVVALTDGWWAADVGPLVARREADGAPVALLPVSARRYRLYDPAADASQAVTEQVAASLRPFAWCFYRPLPPRALTAMDLVRFGARGCRRDLAMVVAMGAFGGLLATALPILTGIIFDRIIPAADRRQLVVMAALLVVAAACASMVQLAQTFAIRRIEGILDASLQAALWDRLLSLPVPFFRGYTAGDLADRSLSITAMRQLVTGAAIGTVLAGMFSIFSFLLLFHYSWRLALLAAALTGVMLGATIASGALQVRYQRESMAVGGRLSGMLLQIVNGVSKLRVSATEHRAYAAWAGVFGLKKAIAVKARTAAIAYVVFASMAPVLSAAVIFAATATLAGRPGGGLSTGDFVAFNAAFAQFQLSVLGLGSAAVTLLGLVPLYERARPILAALPETAVGEADPGDLTGAIEVAHVGFSYHPDAPPVLHDVNLAIPAGRFVAIVGPSGSGKSTLFRLLMGFESPARGVVRFDGQDLAQLDVRIVRRQIGVVLQSGRLLADSLYANIVGSANLTLEDAWAAAAMAGLDADIKAMPMGMHTLLSEGGGGLSGGQRQRILMARAIVRKPRILLFDEATSALDNETQAVITRSLDRLQATRIVIAHRLSTIVHADYIYVMDKGTIVQEGTYEALLRQDGPFAALARRQTA